MDGVGGSGRGGDSGSDGVLTALCRRQPVVADWWSDGGEGNRWAMGAVARKALHYSLQAGGMAHLPLKERLAAEVPWEKV